MSSLKVAVRVRPFNTREIDMDAQLIVQMDGKKTRLFKPKAQAIRDAGRDNHHDFTFDYSYWSYEEHDKHFATQEQVYNDLGTDVIDCAYEGYNACVFAYGQTGSGKTFTMMGTPDNPGLIPRICEELFARMRVGQEAGTGYKTHASYLEIYNERVKDLLSTQNTGHGLKVREHRTLGPYVENLSQHAVSDFDEIQECIARGNIQRTTASTNMNDTSSRSHAIFTITFVQAVFMNDMPSETVSKIHLVDLAGSERANATGATGQRLKEGAHINKSLVTLGSVISALAEQTSYGGGGNTTLNSSNGITKRVLYIPYRDSILTWLLKDSLGGNSKTIMIAALSPADCNYSETLSTLRYANRAKNIINKPTINEDPNVKLIRELREEINKLKSMLTGDIHSLQPSLKMLEDLQKKEAQEKVLTEEWTEKWKEAQSILQEQKSLGLRKSGVGVVLDSEIPHLISIHNEVTTGVTLYSLKEGETRIGTEDANLAQHIELIGDGIRPQHCSIVLKDGNVTLHPQPMAQCRLNGQLIDEPTNISQGDIILLGRTTIFRFNNPAEAAKLRKDRCHSQLNLSRLKWITSSRDDLLTMSLPDKESMSLSMTSLSPYKQYKPTNPIARDDPELQDENREILETIENALKQLNTERVQMHDQYKIKVHKLAEELKRLERDAKDKFEILRYKERELLARKDMLSWEKNNEKVQIDIVFRQISAFQTQLESKKRDFSEYVAKELQELDDCGKLNEIGMKIDADTPLTDDLLLQVTSSLDEALNSHIKETVRRNNEEIRKLDEAIVEKERLLNESTTKIAKIDETLLQIQAQLEHINLERIETEDLYQKKQRMRLNLSKSTTTTDTDAQTDTDISKSDSYVTCDTFHTADSNASTISSPTIADDLTETPLSSCSAGTPSCEGDDDTIPTEKASTTSSSTANRTALNVSNGVTPSSIALMSDSGVCMDMHKLPLNHTNGNDYSNRDSPTTNGQLSSPRNGNCALSNGVGGARTSDDDTASCSSCEMGRHSDISHPYCPMHALRHKIATQKALIMKNLEMNMNKVQLDEQIGELQDLQRRYMSMEKELLETENGMQEHLQCCANDHDYENQSQYEMSISGMRSREMDEYMPTMTRSCPSMREFPETTDHYITIPSFVIRGAGKQTHYEYEVRIALPDGKLNILRRYSRFRELHLSMKHCYGAKIAALPFPRRELFSSNSESVAKHRRRLLELYLRRLFVVCTKIPQCPIYEGPGGPGLTRNSLAQLSPFFKKGLFENGKHGTG